MAARRAKTAPPCLVPRCEPVESYLYLAPGASSLVACNVSRVPPVSDGCVRVVCISDTHNEHEGLRLPVGDVLIHTGDVLTESGMRHVLRDPGSREIVSVKPEGEALFDNFAAWFGKQQFAHKVLVAGNHDLVLQGLGKDRVQDILNQHCSYGKAVYLEDEATNVGGLRVFGSPFAHYTSHNDAFKTENPQYKIPAGIHVVATHMPGVLPGKKGRVHQHPEIVQPMLKAGVLLHVSGHCHWANGLYFAEGSGATSRIPCVVASVCESTWMNVKEMASATGYRGDPTDRRYGGYNLVQPGMICDLALPPEVDTAPTAPVDSEKPSNARGAARRTRSSIPLRRRTALQDARGIRPKRPDKVALLLFCPPNDPELPHVLIPMLEPLFEVVHVETVEAGVRAVGERAFGACVSKLGTKGNLGRDVIAALRSSQGNSPLVVIHSATAAQNEDLRNALDDEFGIGLFAQSGSEAGLVQVLAPFANPTVVRTHQQVDKSWIAGALDWLYGAETRAADEPQVEDVDVKAPTGDAVGSLRPRVLLFAPPNDPGFEGSVLPPLQDVAEVTVVQTAADGVRATRDREYAVCVAKLGTQGNLGVDIIAALRSEFGAAPFVAIHSATAAGKGKLRDRLTKELGVNLFVQHGEEAELIAAVASALQDVKASE